jgi:hypothetical protein
MDFKSKFPEKIENAIKLGYELYFFFSVLSKKSKSASTVCYKKIHLEYQNFNQYIDEYK